MCCTLRRGGFQEISIARTRIIPDHTLTGQNWATKEEGATQVKYRASRSNTEVSGDQYITQNAGVGGHLRMKSWNNGITLTRHGERDVRDST